MAPPVLVELFTSEACSSCPPADALAATLVDGPDTIVLAFHVDYWNRAGWTDLLSNALWTQRQLMYARQFGLRSIYTPRAVVNGRAECVGSDRKRLKGYIEQERARLAGDALVSPELSCAVERADGSLRLEFACDLPRVGEWDLMLALVSGPHTVDVTGGENAGRSLRHDMVVRELYSQPCDGRRVKLQRNIPLPPSGSRRGAIGFLQERKSGQVIGLAAAWLDSLP